MKKNQTSKSASNNFNIPNNLDTKIDFPENVESLNIGDIVEFITKEYEQGSTEIHITQEGLKTTIKGGHQKMLPPTMVVIEVVKENIQKAATYSEQTGKSIKAPIKILCQWYSHKTGKFEDNWFNIGVLKKVSCEIDEITLEINTPVVLKTNKLSNEIIGSKLKVDLNEITTTSYDLIRTFETTNFLPPKMVITSIEKTKEPILFFDKNTGKRKRYASEIKLKCMWYNYLTGKFSENYFIPEALMHPDMLKIDIESISKNIEKDTKKEVQLTTLT